jgi:lipase
MTLRVHEFGDPSGPPVLALHGVAGHGRRWGLLAADSLASYRVLAPDLRGHGESTWNPPWSFARHVADLIATLDELGLESVAVIGHSFGGAVGAQLAAAAPSRVQALALLDPAIGVDAAGAGAMANEYGRHPGFASVEEAVIDRIRDLAPAGHEFGRIDVESFIRRDSDDRYRMPWYPPAVSAALGEVSWPMPALSSSLAVLLLTAGKAGLVTDTLRAALPPHVEVVLDCGHMIYWEELGTVGRELQRFLRAVRGEAPSPTRP